MAVRDLLWMCAACSIACGATGDSKPVTGVSRSAETKSSGWPQWGQGPAHRGSVNVMGQPLEDRLADFLFDPFVEREQAERFGDLLAHYQAPLVVGDDVFMEFETGTWIACAPPGSGKPPVGETACGFDAWDRKTWNEKRLHWEGNELKEKWTFASDWKPEPDAINPLGPTPHYSFIGGWEPVFHGVVAGDYVYVPGAGGTIFKLDKSSGKQIARINPFSSIDPHTFVSGPLSADSSGNIYYNVLKLDAADPWGVGLTAPAKDIPGAWLVKVSTSDKTKMVSYSTLVPLAPKTCKATFPSSALPWPPSKNATPATVTCLSQRPGINVSPAIGSDGTIYSVSRSHNNSRETWMIAVKSDLTPKWASPMRNRLANGCGVVIPIAPSDGSSLVGCRAGTTVGVDPANNEGPGARIIDSSSSTPVALPDGGVLYGAYASYNYARGNLFKFDKDGKFVAAFDFGWDSTPAVYQHGGTYSIIIKDNHYDAPSYCGNPTYCPDAPPGPYYITQLDASMKPEWKFKNTNTMSCSRLPDGTFDCTETHPNGFEWCINAPAVDTNGVVYANSEDGNVYSITGAGKEKQRLFLKLALGAAYTPLSIGPNGRIYTENDGHLFVVGKSNFESVDDGSKQDPQED